jgi:uncharacterized DUF497 family protein
MHATYCIYTVGKALQFEWDDANKGHIAMHAVTPQEVEEVFSRPVYEIPGNHDERRNLCVGTSSRGRMLAIAYTMRKGRIRVVTAYPAHRKQRRQYAEIFHGDK